MHQMKKSKNIQRCFGITFPFKTANITLAFKNISIRLNFFIPLIKNNKANLTTLNFKTKHFPFNFRERAVAFCDNTLLPLMLQSSQQNIELTGGSSILTEFGLCKTTGGTIFSSLFIPIQLQFIK